MRRDRRAAPLPLLLLAATLLTGCGEGAEMEIELFPADRFPELTLAVEDRDGTRVFDRSDLSPPAAPASLARLTRLPTLATGAFEVAEEGVLEVAVDVREGDRTVAEGAIRIDAIDDFRWSVFVAFQRRDPTEGCFGCRGAEAFPVAEEVRAAPAESLWIWWAGRRRGSDVVF